MKRYIEIKGDISFKKYNTKFWELIIEIAPEDITPFFMELQLLRFKHAETVLIKSSSTCESVNIGMLNVSGESKVGLINGKYKLELTSNDIGAISSFILQYYRDACAPVSHMHVDLAKNKDMNFDGDVTLTFMASVSAKPMSGEEAKRLLEID